MSCRCGMKFLQLSLWHQSLKARQGTTIYNIHSLKCWGYRLGSFGLGVPMQRHSIQHCFPESLILLERLGSFLLIQVNKKFRKFEV